MCLLCVGYRPTVGETVYFHSKTNISQLLWPILVTLSIRSKRWWRSLGDSFVWNNNIRQQATHRHYCCRLAQSPYQNSCWWFYVIATLHLLFANATASVINVQKLKTILLLLLADCTMVACRHRVVQQPVFAHLFICFYGKAWPHNIQILYMA